MGNFNNRQRSGDRRGFGNRGGSDRPQMHQAVCANCGNTCEVPFKPNGSKPVYCRDCFQTMGGQDVGRSEGRRFDRPRYESKDDNRGRSSEQPNYSAQFEALNAKLDQILTLLSPQSPLETAPLDSVLNEEIIDELAEEVTDETPKKAVKKTAKKSKASQAK